MRRTKVYRSSSLSTDQDNLDPFLDIISNVVGILIVVAVLIAVSINSATTKVYAPLLYDAPQNLVWHGAYCFEGRVVPCEGIELQSQIEKAAKNQFGSNWSFGLAGMANAWAHWSDSIDSFEGQNFRIEEFLWDSSSDEVKFSMVLKPDNQGDDYSKLKSEKSVFRAFLAARDPTKHGITLIASPSSFREFQVARDLAKSAGFHVEVRVFEAARVYWLLHSDSEPWRRRCQ